MSTEEFPWQCRYFIPSVATECRRVLDETLAKLREQDWIEHDVFAVHLAMEEALMNALKHGNQSNPRKQINVVCLLTPTTFTVTVKDEGVGFDLEAVPDCTDDDRLEIASGRGLLLMRSFMTRIEYNKPGNGVTLEKTRSQAPVAVAG